MYKLEATISSIIRQGISRVCQRYIAFARGLSVFLGREKHGPSFQNEHKDLLHFIQKRSCAIWPFWTNNLATGIVPVLASFFTMFLFVNIYDASIVINKVEIHPLGAPYTVKRSSVKEKCVVYAKESIISLDCDFKSSRDIPVLQLLDSIFLKKDRKKYNSYPAYRMLF